MGRLFFIADTHFGHENSIRFDNRPYKSVEEMDEAIIRNWNSVVSDKDDVYVLGDFVLRNKQDASVYTRRLNGHIHLIRGNHDKKRQQFERLFEDVADYADLVAFDGKRNRRVICGHYFIPFYNGARREGIMLHGHSHCGTDYTLEEDIKKHVNESGVRCEAYNVGAMHIGYTPRTLEEIIRIWDKKKIWEVCQ